MIRQYRGCNIYRETRIGHYARWHAYVRGVFIAADTLSGIRQFIRETLEREA